MAPKVVLWLPYSHTHAHIYLHTHALTHVCTHTYTNRRIHIHTTPKKNNAPNRALSKYKYVLCIIVSPIVHESEFFRVIKLIQLLKKKHEKFMRIYR